MLSEMLDPEQIAPDRVRLLSRKEYDQMVELGIFDNEKVELLRGVIVTMSPQGNEHARLSEWFTRELILALDRRYRVRCALPYAADTWSEPEPDVAVFPLGEDDDHPSNALLLIEVAYSSLKKDRTTKLVIYAEARVPEYWIVDVTARTVEVYTQPQGDRYTSKQVLRDGDVLRPQHVPGVELRVSDMPR